MKHLLTFALCALITTAAAAQARTVKYKNDRFTGSYHTKKGRLSGSYTSYYSNGQKRASGKFRNNYRTGKWTVWDSTGRVRMERDYENSFVFERITPAPSTEPTAALLDVPQYKMHNNADGFVDYFYVEERTVAFSKRLWRYITPGQNPDLFRNDALFRALNKQILNENITAYATKDDQFREKLVTLPQDAASMNVIGYKIKEDFFFDTERLVSETRIVGICPVVLNLQTNDTLDLYWVYYPKARKYLAMETIPTARSYDYVHTLDDVFFHRAFSGLIYKESSILDREDQPATEEEMSAKTARIETDLIEAEHDLWISFTK